MSLLNVHVSPERALVAVDTAGTGPLGNFQIAKLYPLVHANVVLAGRGDRRFIFDSFACLSLADGHVDYDAAVDSFPEMLQRMALHAGAGAPDIPYNIAVVGYSKKEASVCGRWYEGSTAGGKIDTFSLGCRIAPWESDGEPTIPDSFDRNIKLARQQIQAHSSIGLSAGGNLLIAEVTRTQTTIHQACELGQSSSGE